MTGERGAGLAAKFRHTNEAVLGLVAGCSEADWRRACVNEGRSVAVVSYHIAAGYDLTRAVAEAGVAGEPVPGHIGQGEAEWAAINAHQAENQADCTREEIIALLERNGMTMLTFLNGLSDDQLARIPTFAPGVPMALIIEHVIIGHAKGHLASLKATLQQKAQP